MMGVFSNLCTVAGTFLWMNNMVTLHTMETSLLWMTILRIANFSWKQKKITQNALPANHILLI